MVVADYFFWGLVGIVAGVGVASFVSFSNLGLAILAFAATFLAVFSRIEKRVKMLAVFLFLFGFILGNLRAGGVMPEGADPRQDRSLIPQLQSLRLDFERSLNRSLPEPEASLASGIILGRTRKFPQEFTEAMKKTSTLHLVAVSGYNITIVAASILKILEMLTIHRKLAWWVAVFGIILFTLFVGAPASAVRAAIMGFLVLVAKRLGRISDARNAITFAAALMLLSSPSLLRWDLGFQLSFLATIGIIYVSPVILSRLKRSKDLAPPKTNILKEIFSDTLGAQIMVAPWILYKFGTISSVGLAANILILPFIPTAMFMSFVTGIAGLILGSAGKLFGLISFLILGYVTWIIEAFARLPFSSFATKSPPVWIILTIYIFLVGYFVKSYSRSKLIHAPGR